MENKLFFVNSNFRRVLNVLFFLYLYEYPNNLVPVILPTYTTYEDGRDSLLRNVGT